MGRETYELQRTDSICPAPEMQLLEYVKINHDPKIRSFVAENEDIINVAIGHPFDKPILYIACEEFSNRILPQTIETLIELGADLYYSNELHNFKEALHFAALGQNPKVLKVILSRIKPEKINSCSGGDNTALNLLIKEGDPDNPNFLACIRVLIEAGIDINKTDSKNLTPIFWASKKGYKGVVRVILNECKQEVDIDSHKLRGKSARDFITANNLNDVYEDLPSTEVANNNQLNNSADVLFGLLKEYNEEAFINYKYLKNFVDADDGAVTLLQMATKKGLDKAVECLLNNGADPNKITHKNTSLPIEIAATEGYHVILDLLLKHDKSIVPARILTELLKHIDNESTYANVNYNLCYAMLMNYKNLDVNIVDKYNNAPLHYAARYGGAEKTLDLLRCGASMACKNKYGALPIEDIDANTLETHLNECLEINADSNVDKENFTATYNYRTLMPPRRLTNKDFSKSVNDAEAANKLIANEIEQLASETQVIHYMSKSPELKHLLKHPVITSFLYIKWHRIRWFFYTNLAFYITFCLSLILYILLIYGNHTDDQHKVVGYILQVLLSITFTLLILRELFQMAVSPSTYFLNFENWLELLLISLTAVILFKGSSFEDTKKQVSAIAILLAAFEMVLLIGQHPKMSTNIVMLRTVSANFFKFLLWYSVLIIAFSLSFYTLFKDNNSEENSSKNTTSDDEEQNFFADPGLSLFKTIVMLTGEFDAGSINFQVFPITSHIIFMLFVFMIAIILFNLLNGLAVSDTQLIKSNAELVGHIARIEHIAYIESMLLGNILPTNVVNFIQRYCCCLSLNVINRFTMPGILVKRVCLFPYFLKDYKLIVYPNRYAKVALAHEEYSDVETETCIAQCTNIYLDKQTAKRTKQLIKAKKEVLDKEKNEQSVLVKQQQVIEQQQKYIEELTEQQQIILNKLDYIITTMNVKV